MAARFTRANVVRAVDHGPHLILLGKDGVARRLDGDSATLARAVLEFLARPRTRDEVLAELAARSGGPVEHPEVIDQLLELLRAAGAVVDEVPARPKPTGPRVLLGITGAVAAAHSPALVLALQQRGCSVRVVATEAALHFCTREALEALTHHSLASDPIWPDLVLVCPASARTIARIATGDDASPVSAAALAAHGPVVVVPSMNASMYFAPAVQRQLERLRADGCYLVHPAMGTEVADDPDARTPVLGAAPPPEGVADLVMALDRLVDRIEPELAEALAAEFRPGATLLDVGTGPGTVARAASRMGYRVTAIDTAAAPVAGVTWRRADVLRDDLDETFPVVVDRGCLHVLSPGDMSAYVAAIERLVAPGGCFLLLVDAESAPAGRRTQRLPPERIAERFANRFQLDEARATKLGSDRIDAWFCRLRAKV